MSTIVSNASSVVRRQRKVKCFCASAINAARKGLRAPPQRVRQGKYSASEVMETGVVVVSEKRSGGECAPRWRAEPDVERRCERCVEYNGEVLAMSVVYVSSCLNTPTSEYDIWRADHTVRLLH